MAAAAEKRKTTRATFPTSLRSSLSLMSSGIIIMNSSPVPKNRVTAVNFSGVTPAAVARMVMRQAPFALWLTDLSTKDPYFILPLIMGAAMFFQQKLNPQVGDPVQIKVMQIMPVIFTVFFAFFPSGLVLYWVTNTLLSIAQQWKINQVVEAESKQQKGGKKPKNA